MQVIPAIDLRGGRCVRLQQGDFSRESVFGEDPAAIAEKWVNQGAGRIHLVDLDGAKVGETREYETPNGKVMHVTLEKAEPFHG